MAAGELIRPQDKDTLASQHSIFGRLRGSFYQLFTSLRMGSSEHSLGKITLDPLRPTISMLLVQFGNTFWSPLFILVFLFLHIQYSKPPLSDWLYLVASSVCESGNKGEDTSEQRAVPGSLPCSSSVLLVGTSCRPPWLLPGSFLGLPASSSPAHSEGLLRDTVTALGVAM